MPNLHVLSIIAVFAPALIGFIVMMQKSHVVSWIYAAGAIVAIPMIGLPLGIGINLKRLDWPLAYIIPTVLALSVSIIGPMYLKRQEGIEQLSLPFALIAIEFIVCLTVSNSSASWSNEKRLLIALLMIFPIALSSTQIYWGNYFNKSVQLNNFIFRENKIYSVQSHDTYAYHLAGEDTLNFTRKLTIRLNQKESVSSREERALSYAKSLDDKDKSEITTTEFNLTSQLKATLVRQKYVHNHNYTRNIACLFIDSTLGVLEYSMTWKNIPDNEVEKDVTAMIQAAAEKKLPRPNNTDY